MPSPALPLFQTKAMLSGASSQTAGAEAARAAVTVATVGMSCVLTTTSSAAVAAARDAAQLKESRQYEPALARIATLRPLADRFFDKVLVMAEDPAVRANRLALLKSLLREFSTIADFSEIVTDVTARK